MITPSNTSQPGAPASPSCSCGLPSPQQLQDRLEQILQTLNEQICTKGQQTSQLRYTYAQSLKEKQQIIDRLVTANSKLSVENQLLTKKLARALRDYEGKLQSLGHEFEAKIRDMGSVVDYLEGRNQTLRRELEAIRGLGQVDKYNMLHVSPHKNSNQSSLSHLTTLHPNPNPQQPTALKSPRRTQHFQRSTRTAVNPTKSPIANTNLNRNTNIITNNNSNNKPCNQLISLSPYHSAARYQERLGSSNKNSNSGSRLTIHYEYAHGNKNRNGNSSAKRNLNVNSNSNPMLEYNDLLNHNSNTYPADHILTVHHKTDNSQAVSHSPFRQKSNPKHPPLPKHHSQYDNEDSNCTTNTNTFTTYSHYNQNPNPNPNATPSWRNYNRITNTAQYSNDNSHANSNSNDSGNFYGTETGGTGGNGVRSRSVNNKNGGEFKFFSTQY